MSLFLVVHGETGWEAEDRIQGWLDMPLNKEGLMQAEKLAVDLEGEKIKKIYSSPLSRAYDTARIIGRTLGLDEINVDEDLRELDRGKWDGLSNAEVKEKFGKFYEKWYSDPFSVVPPAGETVNDARDRVSSFLQKLFKAHRGNGKNLCVVTHRILSVVIECYIEGIQTYDIWDMIPPLGSWKKIGLRKKRSSKK